MRGAGGASPRVVLSDDAVLSDQAVQREFLNPESGYPEFGNSKKLEGGEIHDA